MNREGQGLTSKRPALGHYTLIREAGRGGMSVVYEASDDRIGRRVAVKAVTMPAHLSPEQREEMVARLRREARSIARLSHPNVVSVYDVGEEDGAHFLVMEYLDGRTLRQRLDAGAIPPAEAARILDQVADALDAVHAQGVVHRDIKPSNVMLLPDGRVKLMDFGVARQADDTLLTQTGMMVGSPAYMAPEIINGEGATRASDLWSLGVLLYQMLAGHPPFDSKNIPTVLYRVTHVNPEPLPGASPPVQQVLARALEKDPTRRYPSGRALADDFHAALSGTARPAIVSPTRAVPRPARPLSPLLAGLLTALVLVGAALGGHWLAGRRQPAPPLRIVFQQSQRTRPSHTQSAAAKVTPARVRVAAMQQERKRPPVISTYRHSRHVPRQSHRAVHAPYSTVRRAYHHARHSWITQPIRYANPPNKPNLPNKPLPANLPRPAASGETFSSLPMTSGAAMRNLTGTWHGWEGIHSHDPAVLQIQNRRGHQFDGVMTIRTPDKATVRVALTGHVSPGGGVSMRETRVLGSTKPNAWDLGFKTGRFGPNGQMSGTDRDARGRHAFWSFSR